MNQNLTKQRQIGWQPKSLISLLVICGTILAVGITASVSYFVVRGLLLNSLKSNVLSSLQKNGGEIDEWLAVLKADVESAANNTTVRSIDWLIAKPYLQSEQQRLPDFKRFSLVKPDGSYYTTDLGFIKGKNLSDRETFQQAIAGKLNTSDLIIARSDGKLQIAIAAPIWSVSPRNNSQLSQENSFISADNSTSVQLPSNSLPTTKPIGVLTGAVAIDRIQQVVSKTTSIKNSYAFALDSKGVPIAHPNRELIQENKSFLDAQEANLVEIAQAMINHQQGVKLVQLGGESFYVAYTPLKNARWSIAEVIPRDYIESQLSSLNLMASVLGILLVLITLIALWQLKLLQERHHTNTIKEVSRTIANSAKLLETTLENQELMATQQATAVNQTTTTMDELGESSAQVAFQAELATAEAGQILTLVDGVGEQTRNSSSLREQVGAITSQIMRLTEQTHQIGNIASLVSDMANQTNMLALNAAVEAVRAGEQGKGFSVIASEIRKLADRSKESAAKINTLVTDIHSATDTTVKVTSSGAKTVHNIVAAVNKIAISNQQISLATKQQAQAIQQVVNSMNSLNENAALSASGISETKVSIQELNKALSLIDTGRLG